MSNTAASLLQYQSSGDFVIALLALWVVLHHAEKVRAMVKRSKDFPQLTHIISSLLSLFYDNNTVEKTVNCVENVDADGENDRNTCHYSLNRHSFERMINALHILLQ